MIDLSDVSGLPIFLDEETGEIHYDSCITCQQYYDVVLSEIIPVLLNKYLKYPEQIYRHFKKIVMSEDIDYMGDEFTYDIVKIPYGLLGIEFIKTHIYYSARIEGKFSCFVEVLNGELTLVLQKNSDEQEYYAFNTLVDEIKIIKLQKGDRAAIPTGYLYTFINTGTSQAIASIVVKSNLAKIDYTMLNKEKGLAFYIISKNARLEVVANPKYRVLERPKPRAWKDMPDSEKAKFVFEQTFGKSPLYTFVKQNKSIVSEALAT